MVIPVLIPAYKPDKRLTELVERLSQSGVKDIIVVDDGSGEYSKDIFEKLKQKNSCQICTHSKNKGKGRAIKTGLQFALSFYPDLGGVITADSDGQHLPEDILNVQNELLRRPGNLIMGCREFGNDIPLRSKFGNELTKRFFHLLTGSKVSDTQTGLRGIPLSYIPACLEMKGERYEYEINMLVSCRKNGIPISEVPVQTVYIDGNKSSHFNPVIDSLKIYFVLLRFLFSSLSTALIDFLVFIICSSAGLSILSSMIFSRLIAANYNFIVNKNIVFRSRSGFLAEFVKYWMLVLILGTISYTGIFFSVKYLYIDKVLSKAIIESLLFFLSFLIQRIFIFHSTDRDI